MPRPNTGYMKQINGIWHVRISKGSGDERKRSWYSLTTSDKRVADRRRQKLVEELESGKAPEQAAEAIPAAMTVEEWAASWNAKRHAQGLSSARDDEQRLRDYALPTIGKMLLGDVRPPHLASVLDDVVLARKSKQTVKHVRAALGRLFAAAWRAEYIDENPMAKVELPKIKATKKPGVILTDDEFLQLIVYLDRRVEKADAWEAEHGRAPKRDASIELRMLCACARILGGMRTSDVNRWDWQQIDLLHFAHVIVPRTKTDEPQDIVVPEDLRPILLDWWDRAGRPTSGPVFPARRGGNEGGFKAERGVSYASRLRRECQRAGLTRPELYRDTARTRRLDFHGFRRAFVTALANTKELSMQQAMALANHGDHRTHMGYVTKTTHIPASAVPNLGKRDHARLASTHGQTADDLSEQARHSGFEPLAFGSGGRLFDHERALATASDEDPQVVEALADDLRSPPIAPDWPPMATGSGADNSVRIGYVRHPRVPAAQSERAGEKLERALAATLDAADGAEDEVAGLLAGACEDLGLGAGADVAAGDDR